MITLPREFRRLASAAATIYETTLKGARVSRGSAQELQKNDYKAIQILTKKKRAFTRPMLCRTIAELNEHVDLVRVILPPV